MNSSQFEDPYDHIYHMDNTTDDTHLIDAHEEIYILDAEKEEIFEYLNENTITEE